MFSLRLSTCSSCPDFFPFIREGKEADVVCYSGSFWFGVQMVKLVKFPDKTGVLYFFSLAITKEKQKIPLSDFLYLLIHTSALPQAARTIKGACNNTVKKTMSSY